MKPTQCGIAGADDSRADAKISMISRIEELAGNVPGWTPVDQLYTLFILVYMTAHLDGDIVEIGSWCGRSTAVLGIAARRVGRTRLHCVDLFPEKKDWKRNSDGSFSFEVEIDGVRYRSYQEQTVWPEPYARDILPLYEKHDRILDVFRETVGKYGLEDLVVVHKGDSARFAETVGASFRCKVAFVDGDHSYESVRADIGVIKRFLVPGGWICFDDAFSSYEGVSRAIEECILQDPTYDLCQQMTRKFLIARKR